MPYMKTSFDIIIIIIIIILYTILKYTTYSKASNDKVYSRYLISSLRHWCVGMRPRFGM